MMYPMITGRAHPREGVAARPSDIDVIWSMVWLADLSRRPMFYADQAAETHADRLSHYQETNDPSLEPRRCSSVSREGRLCVGWQRRSVDATSAVRCHSGARIAEAGIRDSGFAA